MKMGDLVVALDINCGTNVRHTKRDEEGQKLATKNNLYAGGDLLG